MRDLQTRNSKHVYDKLVLVNKELCCGTLNLSEQLVNTGMTVAIFPPNSKM